MKRERYQTEGQIHVWEKETRNRNKIEIPDRGAERHAGRQTETCIHRQTDRDNMAVHGVHREREIDRERESHGPSDSSHCSLEQSVLVEHALHQALETFGGSRFNSCHLFSVASSQIGHLNLESG
jgi:hypothetical protein